MCSFSTVVYGNASKLGECCSYLFIEIDMVEILREWRWVNLVTATVLLPRLVIMPNGSTRWYTTDLMIGYLSIVWQFAVSWGGKCEEDVAQRREDYPHDGPALMSSFLHVSL